MPDKENMNALIMAARHGDAEIANALLGRTNYKQLNYHMDESGKSLLHHAAINDWSQILEDCLKAGRDINVNQIDHSGGTALHYAAKLGCTKCCQVLLQFGASTRLQDRNGRNAAQVAADSGFKDTLVMILSSSTIDVNQCDHEGRNLIHWAATVDFEDVMHQLCERPDAQFDKHDHHGKTPIDYAYICQCRSVGLYLSRRMRGKLWPTPWTDYYDWEGLYNRPKRHSTGPQFVSREDRDASHTKSNNEEWEEIARAYPSEVWALTRGDHKFPPEDSYPDSTYVPPYSYYEGGTYPTHDDMLPQPSGERDSGYNNFDGYDDYNSYNGYSGYKHSPVSTDIPLRRKESPISFEEKSQRRPRVDREDR
jgi:ankyrin repeat protein